MKSKAKSGSKDPRKAAAADERSTKVVVDPREKVLSVRFVLALLLIVVGIAWIAFYYLQVRADPTVADSKAGNPAFMADLEMWNYAIGFGAILLGLAISAHPSTPLGRGRGVVVGMLGCFVIGLLWICAYYVFADPTKLEDIPVFNDLSQWNLVVGIGFMAVGFTFATRWE